MDQIYARLADLSTELAEYFVKGDKIGVEDTMTDFIHDRDIQFFIATFSDILSPGFQGWGQQAAETPLVNDQRSLELQE